MAGSSRTATTGNISIPICRMSAKTVSGSSFQVIRRDGTLSGMTNLKATDKSTYPDHDTNVNVDLSDYGNPGNGTPVIVSGKWAGQNQVRRVEEAWVDDKTDRRAVCGILVNQQNMRSQIRIDGKCRTR